MSTWYLGFNARAGATRRCPRAPCLRARRRPARAGRTSTSRGGRDGRAARSDDARALAPRLSGIRSPTCPAPPERGGLPRSGRGLGEIVLACLDLWEDAASDVAAQLEAVGVRVRLLTAGSDPELDAAVTQQAPTRSSGGGVPTCPIRAAECSMRSCAATRGSTATSSSRRCLLARPRSTTRKSACARTASSNASGSASKPPWYRSHTTTASLWRRPWVTGMWANAVAMSTFADAVVQRPPYHQPSELRCAERMRDTRLAASPAARFRTATCLRRAERLRSLIQALWAGIPGYSEVSQTQPR